MIAFWMSVQRWGKFCSINYCWQWDQWDWHFLKQNSLKSLKVECDQCDQICQNLTTGKNLKIFGNFWSTLLGFGKCWTYFGNKIYDIDLSFIVVNGQNWKQNLTFWSHWMWWPINWFFSKSQKGKKHKKAIFDSWHW